MLENFEILNGEISPVFDPLNNLYTVTISNEETVLDLSYDCIECEMSVVGNNFLTEGENEVSIIVIKNNEKDTYTFIVNREKSTSVFLEEPLESVSAESTSILIDKYEIGYLIFICVLVIIVLFKILFLKKRTNNLFNLLVLRVRQTFESLNSHK